MKQVGWPDLVELSLRLRASRALLALPFGYEQLTIDHDSRSAIQQFQDIVRAVAGPLANRNACPSDCVVPPVEAQNQRVCELYRGARPTTGTPLSDEAARSFDDICSQRICTSCAQQRGTSACTWSESTQAGDIVSVGSGGLCLDPVRELFESCRSIAESAYRKHATRDVPVTLTSGHALQRTGHLGLHVKGQTREAQEPGKREVDVTFAVANIWIDDYLALPYILAHECIAHVWCGVDLNAEDSFKSVAFHEGWMDKVARNILDQHCQRPPDASVPNVIVEYGSEFARVTNRVHAQRYDTTHPEAPIDVAEWIAGTRALRSFEGLMGFAWLDRDLGAPGDQEVAVKTLGFSLQMNASDLSHQERGEFVDILNERFSVPSSTLRAKALLTAQDGIEWIGDWLLDARSASDVVRQFIAFLPRS